MEEIYPPDVPDDPHRCIRCQDPLRLGFCAYPTRAVWLERNSENRRALPLPTLFLDQVRR
ncbi:hypothetical protein ELI52_36500 [Rhizobium ruizarguesonis]|nr:hypothetical protein ELI52_36500 [Rhizobium ruizarguesonis]